MNAGLHGTCGRNAEVPEHKNTKIRPTKFHILPVFSNTQNASEERGIYSHKLKQRYMDIPNSRKSLFFSFFLFIGKHNWRTHTRLNNDPSSKSPTFIQVPFDRKTNGSQSRFILVIQN